jgi:glycerol-3-phosphate acyltransferase PlsX
VGSPVDKADVIVCDGFTGNVVLKFAEGVMFSLQKMVKKNWCSWLSILSD